jgi:predicted nucleic acid-binding protein
VAIAGWVLDESAAARSVDPAVAKQFDEMAGSLFLCPIGELEHLYSARSSHDYDDLKADLRASFQVVAAPPDIFSRALELQEDLAHYYGMWHRTPIPDLLIAEVALHHDLGVVPRGSRLRAHRRGTPANRSQTTGRIESFALAQSRSDSQSQIVIGKFTEEDHPCVTKTAICSTFRAI